jgi:hypothetical protein
MTSQTSHEIAVMRLYNQQLVQTRLDRPEEVVAWLGAVQAQDYAGAKWALALRLRNATHAAIEQAFTDGAILRTHVMRPTWHFVAPADIRWLLALTAPRVHAINATYYRKLELDEALLRRSRTAIVNALEGGKQLTRAELGAVLARAGIDAAGMRLGYLMMHAELDGLVCSGARRGKQFTYALLDERAPQAKPFAHDEALVELTKRYFASHGPATVQDFAWWSGLTQADIKAALGMADADLEQEMIDGRPHWRARAIPAGRTMPPSPNALLLPSYDEYTIAYKNHSAILDPKHRGLAISAIYSGVTVIDGQLVGNWRRTFSKGAMVVESAPFSPLTPAQHDAFTAAAQRYGEFLQMPVVFA